MQCTRILLLSSDIMKLRKKLKKKLKLLQLQLQKEKEKKPIISCILYAAACRSFKISSLVGTQTISSNVVPSFVCLIHVKVNIHQLPSYEWNRQRNPRLFLISVIHFVAHQHQRPG